MATATDDRPAEMTVAAESLAELPPGLAMMKLENDNIQALAMARPRNFDAIKANVAAQMKAFPQIAETAIYSKPVGKVLEITCRCGHKFEVAHRKGGGRGDDRGQKAEECPKCLGTERAATSLPKQRFARNLSIRAAELLAEAYGYNRVRIDVTPVDEDTVKVEATFTDYQGGRIWQDGGIVSKWTTNRWGKTERIPDDRFYNLVVKAEGSRRCREVITRSINAGLKAWFWAEVDKTLAATLTPEAVNKIIAGFARKKVSKQMIEDLLGRSADAWTEDDRMLLKGIWQAIEDGETTVDEAFSIEPAAGAAPAGNGAAAGSTPPTGGTVSASDLTNPVKAPDPAPETGRQQAAAAPAGSQAAPDGKPAEGQPGASGETKPAAAETKPGGGETAKAPAAPADPLADAEAKLLLAQREPDIKAVLDSLEGVRLEGHEEERLTEMCEAARERFNRPARGRRR